MRHPTARRSKEEYAAQLEDTIRERILESAGLALTIMTIGSRSQVEGDRCIGTLAFKQPFIHLKGTNYCTHLLLCRGQDFGRDDS